MLVNLLTTYRVSRTKTTTCGFIHSGGFKQSGIIPERPVFNAQFRNLYDNEHS